MGVIPNYSKINTKCANRIKPKLLRDVKTEAILVFTRTALERYFAELGDDKLEALKTSDGGFSEVYTVLKNLLDQLQDSVVNVDYLMDVASKQNQNALMKLRYQQEAPLTAYYNVMAQQVRAHYAGKPPVLPEFLVICVLAEWLLGEEKSTHCYPYLQEVDFLDLAGKFENLRDYFKNDASCQISDLHELSFKIVMKLKQYKYKVNPSRSSKTRKKR